MQMRITRAKYSEERAKAMLAWVGRASDVEGDLTKMTDITFADIKEVEPETEAETDEDEE